MNIKDRNIIRKKIKKLLDKHKGTIVIYPYGIYGEYVEECLKANGVSDYICVDNRKTGTNIFSFSEFSKKYNDDKDEYVIVISTKRKDVIEDIKENLTKAGIDRDRIFFLSNTREYKNRFFDLNVTVDSLLDGTEALLKIKRGKMLVKKITSNKALGRLYLFSLANVGDTIALAAFSSHVKKMYDADRLILVCRENHKDIADMFDSIDSCIALKGEDVDAIALYNKEKYDCYGSNYIIGNYNLFDKTYSYFSQRTIQFKSLILQIPESCQLDKVSVNFADINNECMRKKWEKAIILCPYAYSFSLLDSEFWNILSERLIDLGYDVYTNVHGKEGEIRGTKRIEKSLREMFTIGYYCNAMISLRSGFCDFMGFNHKLKHIVISPNEFETSFSNIDFYGSKKISNIIWNGNKEEIIKKIMSMI